jgi:hypothetical protein
VIKTKVDPGVCGFTTIIQAESENSQNVSFKISSGCEKIRELAKHLGTVDAFNEIKDGYEGELFKVVRQFLKGCCAGCAVPAGIFKSMQTAAGLALPQEVHITVEKI